MMKYASKCTFMIVIFSFLIFSLAACAVSDGGGGTGYPAKVLKTGQTDSYAAEDDGDLEKGTAWPVPRFTNNGDGTITDNLTGLMWEQTPSTTAMLWADAINHAATVGTAGYTDWRLPNINELGSLQHCGEYDTNDYLHDQGFSATMVSDVWWTSTSYAGNPGIMAWYVSLSYGPMQTAQKNANEMCVICTRGTSDVLPRTGQTSSQAGEDDGDMQSGVAWPGTRFTDNGDGTITDNLTGLMWQKSPSISSVELWADALSEISALTVGEYNDWRMPNIQELRSLLHYGEASQETWLENNGFENIASDHYWSSTTQAGVADRAFSIYMGNGTWIYGMKADNDLYYIAVRDAEE
jgi:hypothetical protein